MGFDRLPMLSNNRNKTSHKRALKTNRPNTIQYETKVLFGGYLRWWERSTKVIWQYQWVEPLNRVMLLQSNMFHGWVKLQKLLDKSIFLANPITFQQIKINKIM
jgi:hypothetical protein